MHITHKNKTILHKYDNDDDFYFKLNKNQNNYKQFSPINVTKLRIRNTSNSNVIRKNYSPIRPIKPIYRNVDVKFVSKSKDDKSLTSFNIGDELSKHNVGIMGSFANIKNIFMFNFNIMIIMSLFSLFGYFNGLSIYVIK
jgi:hypothetical protein